MQKTTFQKKEGYFNLLRKRVSRRVFNRLVARLDRLPILVLDDAFAQPAYLSAEDLMPEDFDTMPFCTEEGRIVAKEVMQIIYSDEIVRNCIKNLSVLTDY